MVDEKFQCDRKVEEYAKRSTYDKAKQLVSTANGCDKIHDKVLYTIDSIGYMSCFCTFRHPHFYDYLFLYKNYERGILPFRGSITEQPSRIIEIFNLIESLKSEREEEDRVKQEKKGK